MKLSIVPSFYRNVCLIPKPTVLLVEPMLNTVFRHGPPVGFHPSHSENELDVFDNINRHHGEVTFKSSLRFSVLIKLDFLFNPRFS